MDISAISEKNLFRFVKSNLKVPDGSFNQSQASKRPDGSFRDLNIVENFHDHIHPSCSEHIQVRTLLFAFFSILKIRIGEISVTLCSMPSKTNFYVPLRFHSTLR